MAHRRSSVRKPGAVPAEQTRTARRPQTSGWRGIGNQAAHQLLAEAHTERVHGNPFEHEAERASTAALHAIAGLGDAPAISMRTSAPTIQRACAKCSAGGAKCDECAHHDAAPAPASSSSTAKTERLIVDDESTSLTGGQERKSAFLARLKQAVCAAADEELARAGRSTSGCPHIAYWFGLLERKDAQFLDRGLRKFAPETQGVHTAAEFIPPIVARVRNSVIIWVETGRVTGVPGDLSMLIAADAATSAAAGLIQRKELRGAATPGATDPGAVRSSLGAGRPLDGVVRSRMESAFSADFSRVRVHADSRAGKLSSSLRAKAFTVGSDVAFNAGEYRPGTLFGDALIAHELAHVVQQGGGRQQVSKQSTASGPASSALEHDADHSALGAVASLWRGSVGGLGRLAREAMPRLRSGVQIRRCESERKICPKGKEWAVMPKPLGAGPVCVCKWHCVYSSAPPVLDASGVPVTSISCRPPCPKPRPPEVVGDDFVQEAEGKEEPAPDPTAFGVGSHHTPLGGAAKCGCIRPSNLVGPGPQVVPLMDPGAQLTDLSPRAGGGLGGARKSAPPPSNQNRIVISGPAVAGQKPVAKPVVKTPPAGGTTVAAPKPKPVVEPVKAPADPVKAPVEPVKAADTKPPLAPPAGAKPQISLETDPSARLVWGTRKSKIFHDEGSAHYEQMKKEGFPGGKGERMTAAQAEAAGYRAAKKGGSLEAARAGTARHAEMRDLQRPDEGKLFGGGWRLVKIERTVGGRKRVDELWVNDAQKRVFVVDTFTGRVEPSAHKAKGWNYIREPEIKALVDKGYEYGYGAALSHPENVH